MSSSWVTEERERAVPPLAEGSGTAPAGLRATCPFDGRQQRDRALPARLGRESSGFGRLPGSPILETGKAKSFQRSPTSGAPDVRLRIGRSLLELGSERRRPGVSRRSLLEPR